MQKRLERLSKDDGGHSCTKLYKEERNWCIRAVKKIKKIEKQRTKRFDDKVSNYDRIRLSVR